jgi:hypothetical protein
MICESCIKLFCRCPTEAHNRQPKGVQYKPLTDDKDEVMAAISADRRAYERALYKRKKDARKDG